MPDDPKSSQQPPASPVNRAARRRRGKAAPSPTYGKVQVSGRGNPLPNPRRWAARRSG
jgi:hypothetical protein